MLDYVQSVLGETIKPHPHLQLQRPLVKLRDPSTNEIVGTTISDVPDLITVTGSVKGSSTTQDGASLLVRLRRGQPFQGEPALTWYINCEQGEIRLTAPEGLSLSTKSVSIAVHHFSTDKVHNIHWEWPKWEEEADLPFIGRSVAKLYEAFHAQLAPDGRRDYPDFADGLKRHEQLDAMLSQWTSV